ncbi:unnamed protein product [Paramecium sonneborni]|uniref:Transmembrane protein n=1 Tax=Paramecium sonneborni TaxID=65129 RepID=A0A8S1RSX1_9CILI|nr:unnamed protein product [Paramecium sonneborni]
MKVGIVGVRIVVKSHIVEDQLFLVIDQWNLNDQFTIYVDNTLVHKYVYSSIDSSTNICGSNDYDSVIQFDLIVDHFSTSSIIFVTTINGGWWGISEFRQYVLKCPFGCDSCNLYYCFKQVLFLELFNKRLFNIQNWEGWYHNNNQIIDINSNWCGFDSQYSPGDYLTKSFILGNHFAVSFQLKVAIYFAINSKVNVEIDGNLISTSELNRQIPTYINDDCGKILILDQINIYQQEHTNNVLTVKIGQFYQIIMIAGQGLEQETFNYLFSIIQILIQILIYLMNFLLLSLGVFKDVVFVQRGSAFNVKRDGNIQYQQKIVFLYVGIQQFFNMKNAMMGISFLMMVVIFVNFNALGIVQSANLVNAQNISNQQYRLKVIASLIKKT